jgi:hypothetical protein
VNAGGYTIFGPDAEAILTDGILNRMKIRIELAESPK